MEPTSESQRDAIVGWLEKDDNFLRVTAFSSPSGNYTRRRVGDLCEAERIENKALSELAASVNVASPRSQWDTKHAKQMLKHYLMEFKSTAKEASKPGFSLSDVDLLFGLKTIEDKLNSMCPHFVRLQMLHDPRIRAAMRGGININNLSREKKDPVQAQISRTLEQAKVMPRDSLTDGANQNDASCKPQEKTANEKQADENSGVMTRNHLESAKGGRVTKRQGYRSSPKTKKRAVSTPKQKRKKDEEESVNPMPKFVELSSDEEEKEDEELPFQNTGNTIVKRRLRRLTAAKTGNSDDETPWLQRKLRRVEASPEKVKRAEAQKTPPRNTRSSTSGRSPTRTTRSTTSETPPPRTTRSATSETPPPRARTTRSSTSDKTPARVTRSTPNRTKKSPGNARKASKTNTQAAKPTKAAAPEKASSTKGSNVANASNPAKKIPASEKDPEATALADSVVFADSKTREATTDAPQSATVAQTAVQSIASPAKQTSSPAQVATEALTPPRVNENSRAATQSTPPTQQSQQWLQVPDALRSAIAQVVSQRQELLNARKNRQPDHSDSDCNDEEDVNNRPRRKASVTSNGYLNGQESPITAQTPGSSRAMAVMAQNFNDRGAPAVSRTSSTSNGPSRPKPSLTAGHIPPLLNFPRDNEDTDIERKRKFLTAKKMAFEQFKWMRENELQQQEMELLRREMETREAFALREIQLQRMNIRVDMIQRMVLGGASMEDITEQLKLLY